MSYHDLAAAHHRAKARVYANARLMEKSRGHHDRAAWHASFGCTRFGGTLTRDEAKRYVAARMQRDGLLAAWKWQINRIVGDAEEEIDDEDDDYFNKKRAAKKKGARNWTEADLDEMYGHAHCVDLHPDSRFWDNPFLTEEQKSRLVVTGSIVLVNVRDDGVYEWVSNAYNKGHDRPRPSTRIRLAEQSPRRSPRRSPYDAHR
jgi:hypothetical protein